MIAKLKTLSSLCALHSLSQIRIYETPNSWGPGDKAEKLQLTSGELVVTKDYFWFVDVAKDENYYIESRPQPIDIFCKQVEAANGEILYFGADLTTLAEAVDEDLEEVSTEAPRG